MDSIAWEDFAKIDLRVGTITSVEPFPEARKPAYRLTIDFGELGVRRSSAQIVALYSPEELVGRQVMAVVNLGEKRIGPFVSQVLTTGVDDEEGRVVLLSPERPGPNGRRLY